LIHAPGHFNWCAYGSDYPPNVLANTNGSYTLAGTPPFTLIASNGTTMQTVNGATIATADVTMTPATITDATGYPGLWCPYTGNDLYMDTTHRCRQRQSGAQNWEAWIKDTRDEELYRIVLMPDDKWWLAQNVKYARAGTAHNSCDKDECGRYYTRAEANAAYESGTGGSNIRTQGVCPYNWLLPLGEDWKSLHVSLGNDVATTLSALRAIDSKCEPVYDTYGWAAKVELRVAAKLSNISGYYQNNLGNPSLGLIMDVKVLSLSAYEDCGSILLASNGSATAPAMVRCFRQL
jgi:uncharacterized protein (TIGR02145 family)